MDVYIYIHKSIAIGSRSLVLDWIQIHAAWSFWRPSKKVSVM